MASGLRAAKEGPECFQAQWRSRAWEHAASITWQASLRATDHSGLPCMPQRSCCRGLGAYRCISSVVLAGAASEEA